MAVVTACPDRDVLTQLLLGRIVGPEAERLASHLEECDLCAAVVKALPAEDTFVAAARSQPTAVDTAEMSVVRNLVERLQQQGPASAAASADATGLPTTGNISAAASASGVPLAVEMSEAEQYSFLAPPQGTDELGRLGSYRILKVLGAGGMGVVFQAEDTHLRRRVALKVMKPEAAGKQSARERFLREARAAANLEHDHIVSIYQVGEESGVPFLAMQWLKGMSLEDRLRQPEPLSLLEVLRLGLQIAHGLAAAHDAGVIHRDIMPANLWLEQIAPGLPGEVADPPASRGFP